VAVEAFICHCNDDVANAATLEVAAIEAIFSDPLTKPNTHKPALG
jgi:hypothetical protein